MLICAICATDCRESYVTGCYFYGALWFLATQTNITKFFSASHNFCGGGSLQFSQLGPGLVAIFMV